MRHISVTVLLVALALTCGPVHGKGQQLRRAASASGAVADEKAWTEEEVFFWGRILEGDDVGSLNPAPTPGPTVVEEPTTPEPTTSPPGPVSPSSAPTSSSTLISSSSPTRSPIDVGTGNWVPLGQGINPVDSAGVGVDVAMSADGNYLAVGVPRDAPGYVAVYGYNKQMATWEIVDKEITFSEEGGGGQEQQFGTTVDLSSDGLTVTAGSGYNNGFGPAAIFGGRARVYTLQNKTWVPKGQPLYGAACRSLGWSVALSGDGNRWVVSTPDVAGSGNFQCSGADLGSELGMIQIFDYVGDTWTQVGQNLTGRYTGNNFGISVAISRNGKRVAAYSPGYFGPDPDRNSSVAVFEFVESSGQWIEMDKDIMVELPEFYTRGVALSATGDRIAVASKRFADGTAFTKVLEWTGEKWMQLGDDIEDEDGCCFFYTYENSVRLSDDGSRLIFGNSGHEPPGTPNPGIFRGIVRVYDFIDEAWVRVGQSIPGDTVPYELWFGYSTTISADGSRIAAGAPIGIANYAQAYEYVAD